MTILMANGQSSEQSSRHSRRWPTGLVIGKSLKLLCWHSKFFGQVISLFMASICLKCSGERFIIISCWTIPIWLKRPYQIRAASYEFWDVGRSVTYSQPYVFSIYSVLFPRREASEWSTENTSTSVRQWCKGIIVQYKKRGAAYMARTPPKVSCPSTLTPSYKWEKEAGQNFGGREERENPNPLINQIHANNDTSSLWRTALHAFPKHPKALY